MQFTRTLKRPRHQSPNTNHSPLAFATRSLLIGGRVEGELDVGIVFVEVDGNLLGDDVDELSLELSDRFVLGGDAAVFREENLSEVNDPKCAGPCRSCRRPSHSRTASPW